MPIPLDSIARINIFLSNPGITVQGFGVAAILSNTGNAWETPELTRSYTSLAGLLLDFPITTAEYQCAAVLFAQPLKPVEVVVIKGTNKPTKILKISGISAVNSTAYTINTFANGVQWQSVYTSDSSATVAEIVAGLVVALNCAAWVKNTAYIVGDRIHNGSPNRIYQCITAGTSENTDNTGPMSTSSNITDGTVHWEFIGQPGFTATSTDTASTVTCTGDAAGNWFTIEPLASGDQHAVSNLMALSDTTTDPGVATDLAAGLLADPTWYALLLLFKSKAIVSTASTGAAAWCEANQRLLIVSTVDTASATVAYASGTDTLAVLTAAGYSYTGAQWHPREYEWLDAATDGYFLPRQPGKYNVRMKPLVGPTAVNFSSTQVTNLNARRAGYYTGLGSTGTNVLAGNGNVESTLYGFIDTRVSLDWYAVNLQARLVDLQISEDKVFHTNAGLQQVDGVITTMNELAITQGVLSPDPFDPLNNINQPYIVTVPKSTTPGTFDPATRAQSGISTRWRYASAINSFTVDVYVSQ